MPSARTSRTMLALLWLYAMPPAALALEMFGLRLEQSNATSLRQAVKQAGATLVREGGANRFDLYRSERLLAGSRWLFLGFADNGNRFAFLEYSLPGYQFDAWIERLSSKYGPAEIRPGRFLSDTVYLWNPGPIRIRLYKDFRQGGVRLEYADPTQLEVLRQQEGSAQGGVNPAFY